MSSTSHTLWWTLHKIVSSLPLHNERSKPHGGIHIQWNLWWETTVKRQQPLMRDHFCSNISLHFHAFLPPIIDHVSYKTTFCGPVGWSLISGFTVIWNFDDMILITPIDDVNMSGSGGGGYKFPESIFYFVLNYVKLPVPHPPPINVITVPYKIITPWMAIIISVKPHWLVFNYREHEGKVPCIVYTSGMRCYLFSPKLRVIFHSDVNLYSWFIVTDTHTNMGKLYVTFEEVICADIMRMNAKAIVLHIKTHVCSNIWKTCKNMCFSYIKCMSS